MRAVWVSDRRAETGCRATAMKENRGSYLAQVVQTVYVTVGFIVFAWIFAWEYAGHCR